MWISRFLSAISIALMVVFPPLLLLHWAMCRMWAKPCPNCGERWHTELVGEWQGEDWKCQTCGHYWEVPYGH